MKYLLKRNNFLIFITILGLTTLIIQSCGSSKEQTFKQDLSSPKELTEHSLTFPKHIRKVGDNIYMAIGYGLANSILIEGKDSVIIIDVMESRETGAEVRAAFDSVVNKPVAALIYTHFHTDHSSGGKGIAGNDNPRVFSHELLPKYLDLISAVTRDITEKRAYRMFGVYLEPDAHINCGIGPYLDIEKGSTLGILRPTDTFKDSLDVTIAGIHFQLFHAPGETRDQLFVWLPESKALFCGDNIYKTFPNLYTIRGTAYRDVNLWKNSLDKMRFKRPELLIPSHTTPIEDADSIYNTLTIYRDAIQFIHDQTVRNMNKGKTPNEIVEKVILPDHLKNSEWLQEFYGKTQWSVRTIFDGYLGFFDGNPSTLLPLQLTDRAEKMQLLVGGKEKLMKAVKDALDEGSDQWALELTDYLFVLYPKDKTVIDYRTKALTALGQAQSNPNARHYYLTMALELQGLENDGLVQPTSDLVNDIPLSAIFNGMAVKLKAEEALDIQQKVHYIFTDTDERWTVEIRNGIAEVQPFLYGTPDLTVKVNSLVYKEIGAKIRNPAKAFLTGEIDVDGGQVAFIKFIGLFDI